MRNLVVVRAGDGSRHEGWLAGSERPNWDLIVSYYGSDPDLFRSRCMFRDDVAGPKFPALAKLLDERGDVLAGYDYVMFPDDDLDADVSTINRFFNICRDFNLDLAQPALTPQSYYSHPVSLQNAGFLLRYSNLIEIMAPCFSRSLLERCAATFSLNASGWGLDWIWPRLAGDYRTCAIVDAAAVSHLRPIGGPMHGYFAKAGIDPFVEMKTALARYGLTHTPGVSLGGIDLRGRTFLFDHGCYGDFLIILLAGYARDEYRSKFDLVRMVEANLKIAVPSAAATSAFAAGPETAS